MHKSGDGLTDEVGDLLGFSVVHLKTDTDPSGHLQAPDGGCPRCRYDPIGTSARW